MKIEILDDDRCRARVTRRRWPWSRPESAEFILQVRVRGADLRHAEWCYAGTDIPAEGCHIDFNWWERDNHGLQHDLEVARRDAIHKDAKASLKYKRDANLLKEMHRMIAEKRVADAAWKPADALPRAIAREVKP